MMNRHYLQAFPDATLADPAFEDVCFPLYRLALKRIDPTWSGWATWFYTLEDPYRDDPVEGPGCIPDHQLSYTQDAGRATFLVGRDFFDVRPEWAPHLEAVRQVWSERKRPTMRGRAPLRWGGSPKWIQDDRTPRDSRGRKMVFIGQVDSLQVFPTMVAKVLYLFADPDAGRFTQVSQST
jgi:hypothetical protein